MLADGLVAWSVSPGTLVSTTKECIVFTIEMEVRGICGEMRVQFMTSELPEARVATIQKIREAAAILLSQKGLFYASSVTGSSIELIFRLQKGRSTCDEIERRFWALVDALGIERDKALYISPEIKKENSILIKGAWVPFGERFHQEWFRKNIYKKNR